MFCGKTRCFAMDYTHQRRWIPSEFFWKVLLCSCKPSRNIRASLWYICQQKLIPTLFWAQLPIKAPCLFIRIQCVKTKKQKQKTKRDCAQPFFYLLFEHRAKDFVLLQSFQQQLELILPGFFYADNPTNCSSDICSTGELSRIFQFLYITSCWNTLRIVYQHRR